MVRPIPSSRCRPLAGLALAAWPALAGAAGGAHEHGLTTLNVAVDGPGLALELEGPAANFAGFEAAPRTADERAAVAAATARLRAAETLFTPAAAARCRLASVELRLPWAAGAGAGPAANAAPGAPHGSGDPAPGSGAAGPADEAAHDPDHGHDHEPAHASGHGHDPDDDQGQDLRQDQDDDRHDEHRDEHADAPAAAGGDGHTEVYAYYAFDCAAPAALAHLDAAVIAAFPLTERVEVRILGPGGQGFAELAGGNTRVEIPR